MAVLAVTFVHTLNCESKIDMLFVFLKSNIEVVIFTEDFLDVRLFELGCFLIGDKENNCSKSASFCFVNFTGEILFQNSAFLI